MSVFSPAPAGRLGCAWLCATVVSLLSACSGGSARAPSTPTVGTTTNVVLTTSTGSTQVQQSGSLVLSATVAPAKDPSNLGVSWTLVGVGALSSQTNKSVTYSAPASGITGISTPVITATAVADTTLTSSATLVVSGTPVLAAPVLFPANVGTPYGAQLIVSGGLAPFTWAQGTGTLPPGITLTTSTLATTTFSGTPTTAGTYHFQVTVTDHNSPANVATVDLTVLVNPAAACLLNGQYALVYTGFVGNQTAVSAASLTVTTAGTITGYHDAVSTSAPVAETVTGTCTTRTANNGTLTVTGATTSPVNSPQYDYAVTTALTNGRIQLMNGADSQSGTGLFLKQDPTAFAQASLAGSFAFGTLGAQADGKRMGLAGAITFDAGGLVAGHADSNGSSALTDAPLSGNLGSPDANGRGTLTLTTTAGGGQTFHFAYYIVSVDRLLLVTTDAAPRLAGFMTRQAGAGAYANAALASPGILSLWGAAAVSAPKSVLSLGRLSNANTANGTIDLRLDTADQLTTTFDQAYNGAAYAVRADGRVTFSFVSGATTRQFALYLDGTANGYAIEQGSAVGSAGLLEAQSAGPFTNTIPGFFVSGTQFAQDVAPILLLPAVNLANGSLSATQASGIYTVEATTGHAIGQISVPGAGGGLFALYIVGPNKLVTFRKGSLNRSAVMDWLGAN